MGARRLPGRVWWASLKEECFNHGWTRINTDNHELIMAKKLNVKLLRKVQRLILAHPDQVNMDAFLCNRLATGHDVGGCGTAGCIGGWALFASSREKTLAAADMKLGPNTDIWGMAANRLGLTDEQEDSVFIEHGWPKDLKRALRNAGTPAAYAAVVAKRIDRLIETGK